LSKLWLDKQRDVDLATPLNFVATLDIIGGNSGSPVVNRAGEFVGIIFDGNLQSLPWDYQFDDRVGRAVAVHSAGIIDALTKVYNAPDIVKQLNGK
jgi:V8-like Glu-specific endopeptidase